MLRSFRPWPLRAWPQVLLTAVCRRIVARGVNAGALRHVMQEIDGAIGTCDGREHRLAKLENLTHLAAEALRSQPQGRPPTEEETRRWYEIEEQRKAALLAYRAPGAPPPKPTWTFKLDTKPLSRELAEFQRQLKERLAEERVRVAEAAAKHADAERDEARRDRDEAEARAAEALALLESERAAWREERAELVKERDAALRLAKFHGAPLDMPTPYVFADPAAVQVRTVIVDRDVTVPIAEQAPQAPAGERCIIFEYDGAYRCSTHGKTWGAITNPMTPCPGARTVPRG